MSDDSEKKSASKRTRDKDRNQALRQEKKQKGRAKIRGMDFGEALRKKTTRVCLEVNGGERQSTKLGKERDGA